MSPLYTPDEQTIVAQSTAQGSGALAIIRACGLDVFTIADKICRADNKKPLSEQATHTIAHGIVCDTSGTMLDDVLFYIMRGPRTFTGQDTLEISCHNNQFIVNNIIASWVNAGARLASPGEFTRRSVLAGKIDLVQAEAIAELISAQSQQAIDKSLAQLKGSLSCELEAIATELVRAIALCEASFEFLDEELEFGTQIKTIMSNVIHNVDRLRATYSSAQHIRTGVRIALIGSVNAGKSSLFNSLIGSNRAIVTDIEGTTRDVVEAGLYVSGMYWTLVDTAGLRHTSDIIEQEGIRRSYEQAHMADIVLLVHDAHRQYTVAEQQIYDHLSETYRSKIIMVRNKIDLLDYSVSSVPSDHVWAHVSSTTDTGIQDLKDAIEQKIQRLFTAHSSPFLLNARHMHVLTALHTMLHDVYTRMEPIVHYELVSYHLNDALVQVCELTGKSISEQALDAVFREFCVGK
ncbi:hypothetical protein J120_04325 [candidate division TM6 bacterium JCVI TM6SC1]|uniref:tRNA modification GTPase MnmE n=1 Tax=candidate division TM6 bacterium JCVI TM6SC1 TaxID=1306947 RepID=A0A0D2JKL2_9BACT|nr:hypothetical protein J120_04325 [candidate division TM6 bacterium JCVI TM6SC1]